MKTDANWDTGATGINRDSSGQPRIYGHPPPRLCFLFVYSLSSFPVGFLNIELLTGLVPLCKDSKEELLS